MSEFHRLAKEDYELMGRASIWTDFNAVTMLASYEMEVSGAFGESKELFQFNRLAFRSAQGLEKAFHEKWSKWFNFVSDAIANGDILYANTPERGAPPADPDATTVQVVGNCTFEPKELITSISKAVATGDVAFDMESFISFLLGNGDAPERVRVVEVEKKIERIIEKEVDKIIEVKVPPSEFFSEAAKKRHEVNKPKLKALQDFLLDDLSRDCTCTKSQAVDRIFKDRYKEDKKYLKSETGYSFLSFTREVTKALQKIEEAKPEDRRINRHENTTGFSRVKVPACTKHKSK